MNADQILKMQCELDLRLKAAFNDFIQANFKHNDEGEVSPEDAILGLELLEPILEMSLFLSRERKSELLILYSSLSKEEKDEAFNHFTLGSSERLRSLCLSRRNSRKEN